METRKKYDEHTGTWKLNKQRQYGFKKFRNAYQHTGVNIDYLNENIFGKKCKKNIKNWNIDLSSKESGKRKCEFLDFGIDLEPTPIPSNWNKCKLIKPVISTTQSEKEIKSDPTHLNSRFALLSAKAHNNVENKEEQNVFKDISISAQSSNNKDFEIRKISDSPETSSNDVSIDLSKSNLISSSKKLVSVICSGIPCGQKDKMSVNEKVEADDKLSLLHNFFNDLIPPSLPPVNQRPLYFEQFDIPVPPSNRRNAMFSNNEVPVESFSNSENCDKMFNFSLTAGQRIADSPLGSIFQDPINSLIDNTFVCSNHSLCKDNKESVSIHHERDKIADDHYLKSSSTVCSDPFTGQNECKMPLTSKGEKSSITEPVLSMPNHSNVTFSENYCNGGNLNTTLHFCEDNFRKDLKTIAPLVNSKLEENNYLQNDKLNHPSDVDISAINIKSEIGLCLNSSENLSECDNEVNFSYANSANVVPLLANHCYSLNDNVSSSAVAFSTGTMTSTQNSDSLKKLSFPPISPVSRENYENANCNISLNQNVSSEVEKNSTDGNNFSSNVSVLTNIESKNLGAITSMSLDSIEANTTDQAKEGKLGENFIKSSHSSKCTESGSHKTLSPYTDKLFSKSNDTQDIIMKLKDYYNTDIVFQPVVKLTNLSREEYIAVSQPNVKVVKGCTNENNTEMVELDTKLTNEGQETIKSNTKNEGQNTIMSITTNEGQETLKSKVEQKKIETKLTNEGHKITDNTLTSEDQETTILNDFDLNVELILKTIKKLFNTKKQESIKDKSIKWKFLINLNYGDNEKESLTFNLSLNDNVTHSSKIKNAIIDVIVKPLNNDDHLPDDTSEKNWWKTALLNSPYTNASRKSRKILKSSKFVPKKSKFVEKEKLVTQLDFSSDEEPESEDSDLDLAYDKNGKIILQRSSKKPSTKSRKQVIGLDVIEISDDDVNTHEVSTTELNLSERSNKNYTFQDKMQSESVNYTSCDKFDGHDSIILEKRSKLMTENCSEVAKDKTGGKSNDLDSIELTNDVSLKVRSNIKDKLKRNKDLPVTNEKSNLCQNCSVIINRVDLSEKEPELIVPVTSENVASQKGNDNISSQQQRNRLSYNGNMKKLHEVLKYPIDLPVTTEEETFIEQSLPNGKSKHQEPIIGRPNRPKIKNRLLKLSVLQNKSDNFIFKRNNKKYTLKQQICGETQSKDIRDYSDATNDGFICLESGPLGEKTTTQKPVLNSKNVEGYKTRYRKKNRRPWKKGIGPIEKFNKFNLWKKKH